MAETSPDREALLACLAFQVAAGVDLALDETPHDRLASPPPAATLEPSPEPARIAAPALRAAPLPQAARSSASSSLAADEIAADARSRAAGARSLDELRALLDGFEGCGLKSSAKQLVFSDGTPGAPLMILGEAPGADEDRTGRAFVGRAGQLLDRMLDAIGLDRSGVYVANVVPWRPPGNRTPTPQEVAVCLPFTLRQIELAAPRVLVTLGAPATQTVLGVTDGIFRTRGRWVDRRVGSLSLRAFPMLHPAYLLRQPLHKRLAWRDLRELRRGLERAAAPELSRTAPL